MPLVRSARPFGTIDNMNLTSILLLLQLAVSLLAGAQNNARITAAEKNQALSFATQAVALSQAYLSQNSAGAPATPTTTQPAIIPAPSPATSSAPAAAASSSVPSAPQSGSIFATPLGVATGRAKNPVDDMATLTFSPAGAGGISLTTLKITFSGSLAGSSFSDADVKLLDASNAPVGTLAPVSCVAGTPCVMSWSSFGSGGIVSAGSSLVLKLRIDSLSHTVAAMGGSAVSFSATIQSPGDLTYNDSVDGTGSTVSLPATAVPLVLNSVSYAPGT